MFGSKQYKCPPLDVFTNCYLNFVTDRKEFGVAMLRLPETDTSGFRVDQFRETDRYIASGEILDGKRVQASIFLPEKAMHECITCHYCLETIFNTENFSVATRSWITVFANMNLFQRRNVTQIVNKPPNDPSVSTNAYAGSNLVFAATKMGKTSSKLEENVMFSVRF